MAIPTFDRLLRPTLAAAERGNIRRREITAILAKEFGLTEEESSRKLASGESIMANRASWAMTFLTKAKLIEKIGTRTYGITEAGRLFLQEHPAGITTKDLETVPGFGEAWNSGRDRRQQSSSAVQAGAGPNETATPQELIEREVKKLDVDFRRRLLSAILSQSPQFFEELVLDVLVAMGYGGSREAAAERLGRSGDEGIDGCINQDALGLDQIMVQAKRYSPENIVDRKTIQAFIGSLAGQGVTKGVFITTSSFAESAKEFVLRGSTTKVILVDGDMLIDRMIQHRIGARVAHTFEIHELDQNYFDEGE